MRTVVIVIVMTLLSMRYVRIFAFPLSMSQQQTLIEISDKLGIEDYELLFLCTVWCVHLLVAVAVYVVIAQIWCRYRSR
ncbi:hypothetical protein AWB74_01353 [Caballeronia arvi]|uniref:Uncharacterized protein n=1 Tax=Caballeronia arvi TaxID=1777135 RepID=A0A158GJ06_9BURK|nr:hypothetical protein AWB74_01353 [Caballeronia arvi]